MLQMVSYRAARAMLSRLVSAYGRVAAVHGPYTIRWFPEAEALASASVDELRSRVGVSRVKAEAIRAVARLETKGVLGELEREAWRDPHAVAAELTRIRGVGRWTAYLALMAG